MANLATIGPNNRFDTLRPAPPRLVFDADRLDITSFHDLYLALTKGTNFLRSVEALLEALTVVAKLFNE